MVPDQWAQHGLAAQRNGSLQCYSKMVDRDHMKVVVAAACRSTDNMVADHIRHQMATKGVLGVLAAAR